MRAVLLNSAARLVPPFPRLLRALPVIAARSRPALRVAAAVYRFAFWVVLDCFVALFAIFACHDTELMNRYVRPAVVAAKSVGRLVAFDLGQALAFLGAVIAALPSFALRCGCVALLLSFVIYGATRFMLYLVRNGG